MARVGGRNTVFAWFVGMACAVVVVTLAVVALPLFPAATGWFAAAYDEVHRMIDPDAAPVAVPARDAPPAEDDTASDGCRGLYDDALWATLRQAEGSEMTTSTDPPVTSASAFAEALQPQVSLTCAWSSDEGRVSATIATVPTDAGVIASAALPALGFACETRAGRTLCTRTDGELLETIESAGGTWISTSQEAWHPNGYAARVAERVWARAG